MRSPERTIGLAAAVGLHAAAATLLLSYAPARSALLAATPVMVELLAPPAPVAERKSEPRIEPRKPKPVRKRIRAQRPVQPPRVVAAPPETAAPIEAPPPPVEVVTPSEPEPAPPPVLAPATLPVTEPIFKADYLENPAPAYPALSRRIREEGRVVLRVLVSSAGIAERVQVRSSSGYTRLDEAARTTVARWRFVPAKRGEQPTAAWVLIPISFELES
jgi:protein TonB